MKLRRPSARLADVCWFARFIDKARAHLGGTLPPEYARRFGDSKGIDGVFLRHFSLEKEAFVEPSAPRLAATSQSRNGSTPSPA